MVSQGNCRSGWQPWLQQHLACLSQRSMHILWCAIRLSLCACRFLDKAALSDRAGLTGQGHAVSRTQVEETKAFIGIMPLFLCICIYQMAYDPIL